MKMMLQMLLIKFIGQLERCERVRDMLDIQKQINNVIAAMLTIAWASTKKRDISQDEVNAVYKNFCGNK